MYPVHRRSSAYMVQLSCRLRNSNSRMASTLHPSMRLVCQGVECSMRCENQSKLPWRWRCVTSSIPSESICNAAFFFAYLWDPVIFFFSFNFESHVDQTKDGPGIRIERQKTEDLSKGAQTAITWTRWRFSETWAPNAFRCRMISKWPGTLEDWSSNNLGGSEQKKGGGTQRRYSTLPGLPQHVGT